MWKFSHFNLGLRISKIQFNEKKTKGAVLSQQFAWLHLTWCLELRVIKRGILKAFNVMWAGMVMLLFHTQCLCLYHIYQPCHSPSHSDVYRSLVHCQTACVKQPSQQAIQSCRWLIHRLQTLPRLRHLPSAKNLFVNLVSDRYKR